MQRLSSSTMLLGSRQCAAARVAPYRRTHVCRCCHSAAQSSGTPLIRCDSTRAGGVTPQKSLQTQDPNDRMGCQT